MDFFGKKFCYSTKSLISESIRIEGIFRLNVCIEVTQFLVLPEDLVGVCPGKGEGQSDRHPGLERSGSRKVRSSLRPDPGDTTTQNRLGLTIGFYRQSLPANELIADGIGKDTLNANFGCIVAQNIHRNTLNVSRGLATSAGEVVVASEGS
jgi:hypothetical protein